MKTPKVSSTHYAVEAAIDASKNVGLWAHSMPKDVMTWAEMLPRKSEK